MTAADRVDAIVVGAGPVGMTAAAELARYGMTVRVFDKRAHTASRTPGRW